MPQVVGLDIGASAVRAAELDIGSGQPELVAFGQVGLPPGAIVDGEVQDASAIADAIKRLWVNGKFTSRSAVVGLAGLRAITREIDLPYVPDSEIDSAVRFQSEEVIPFPPDKTILSAQVLADYQAPDGATMRRVLVAAAHRDLVSGVVGAVEKADITVEGVDLVSSALVRALTDPAQLANDEPVAIVSVGAGLTVVVVHQQGRPQFVRTIGTGGNAATAAISAALDLPMADAEAVKRRLGEQVPQVQAAERSVQGNIAELVAEIRNSIQYFASLPGRAPIARVLVTGGGSRLRGFLDQLQAQVRIPVQAVSPLARLDISKVDLQPEQAASIDPVLATPIGLALPEPNPTVHKFNLIPPEVVERAFQRKLAKWSLVGAVAVAVILLGFSALRFVQVHNDENDVNQAKASIATLQRQIPKYDPVVAANKVLHQTKGEVTSITTGAPDWYPVLNALAADTPCLGAPYNGCLDITSFSGTAASSSSSATSTTSAGSIGTMSLSVSGTFSSDPHFSPVALWLDQVGAPMFSPPSVAGASNTPASGGTQVTFQSTVDITSAGSLAKNASY